MKCETFKENIGSMIEPDAHTAELEQHLAGCAECTEYYRTTLAALRSVTPVSLPAAPASLAANVLDRLETSPNLPKTRLTGRKLLRMAASTAALFAAVGLILWGVRPGSAHAASIIFDQSLKSTEQLRSMVMKLNVRTLPRDNFALIDLEAEMVPHTLTVLLDTRPQWRLDKGGRIVMYNGQQQYMWIPDLNEGVTAGIDAGFAEWFRILLNPRMILEKEKAAAEKGNGKYRIRETDSEIHLTIEAKAQGKFTNNYLLNSSVEESDNRREYIFDRETGLIRSLKVFVLEKNRETLVIETTGIIYNAPVDGHLLTALPERITWQEQTVPTGRKFANISAKEAAELVFDALSRRQLPEVKEMFQGFGFSAIEKKYGGLKLIRLGEPFQSGLYPGWFVPYKIVLPDGKTEKWNLALRNDNPNRVWKVDGGL